MAKVYNDSPEKAGQVARNAIPMAAKLGLPVNPHIYAVCYEYTAKLNNELCEAFDALLEKHPQPDKLMVELLYKAHVIDEDVKAVEFLKGAVESIINSTESALQSAEDSTQNYGESLSHAADELDSSSHTPELVMGVVKKLLQETTQMQTASKGLQEQLSSAKSEIAELKEEYKRIQEESFTDPLTGTKNRRAFEDAFQTMCDKHKHDATPLSVLVIDIDHFKKVNDNFGHIVGDAVLRCLGKIISNSVRGDDLPTRFGGEEFVVLLPDTPLEGAAKVAEKIRKTIAAQNFRHGEQSLGCITISVGAAQLSESETSEAFLDRADNALYAAKKAGRNQVCKA